MSTPQTLNELSELKNSGFGRPPPRHGLKLLYWFANDYLFFNNNNKMCWVHDPKNQYFGFHRFRNRQDRNGVKLLPDANLIYYMVGNLNSAGADELPDYVREHYGNFQKGNNMDRIIVSVNGRCFDRVYVTEHSDRKEFNKEATYCISTDLIIIIRGISLQDFLLKTGFSRAQEHFNQIPGYLRAQDYYNQIAGYLRAQDDYNQRAGSLRAQVGYNQRSGFSRAQEHDSQRTGESSDEFTWDDNESTSCCKCVIL